MSPEGKAARVELAQLLNRLETKAEEGFARAHFRGRAVSKSADNLHLSVPMGIVAIPLGEIERISPISDNDPTLVAVTVRNGDRVKSLLTVHSDCSVQREARLFRPPPRLQDVPSVITAFTYSEVCTDSATGGEGLDDTICGLELTDENTTND